MFLTPPFHFAEAETVLVPEERLLFEFKELAIDFDIAQRWNSVCGYADIKSIRKGTRQKFSCDNVLSKGLGI